MRRFRSFYPMYTVDYASGWTAVYDRLKAAYNLVLTGRLGMFNYNNSDHCLDMGRFIATELAEGVRPAAHLGGAGGARPHVPDHRLSPGRARDAALLAAVVALPLAAALVGIAHRPPRRPQLRPRRRARTSSGFAPQYEIDDKVATHWTTYHATVDLPLTVEAGAATPRVSLRADVSADRRGRRRAGRPQPWTASRRAAACSWSGGPPSARCLRRR